MDVNGTPYLLLRESGDFLTDSPQVAWNPRRGALTLRQEQELRLPQVGAAEALAAWQTARPLVLDPFGQTGRISDDGAQVQLDAGRGPEPLLDGDLAPVVAPAGRLTDLSLGGSGRLVATYSDGADTHGLLVFHLGRRWQAILELPEAPIRAVLDREDRIWCLSAGGLLLAAGEPLPLPYRPDPARFEPLEVNPHPLRLLWRQPLPPGTTPLALAADLDAPPGQARLYLLSHDGAGHQRVLTRPLDPDPGLGWDPWALPADLPFVIDLAPMPGTGRLAALAPREPGAGFTRRDCPVLEPHQDLVTGGRGLRLVGERFPMRSLVSPRLVSALDGRVRYQAAPEPGGPGPGPIPRELLPLPRPVYPVSAQAELILGAGGEGLDSGMPGTCWHRVYIDGCIPPGCWLLIDAQAYDQVAARDPARYVEQPAPLWSPLPCELPAHAGLAPRRPGESGLFEVLLQGRNGRVRELRGRYLQLRLRLKGDGRQTPAIHALRIYYPRFCYQEHYLPEHFRQAETPAEPPDTDPVAANAADVRERLLAAWEGVLTPIEGRVAAAESLLHPDSAPAALLPGLAEALGLRLPPWWPEERRRRQLRQGCLVQQWHGTYPGLRLALDIATGGAVARGQVVVVENFRLRRTLATILGIAMDDGDHPLTLGTGMSGNSLVGDSLILADDASRDFLALFAPELAMGDDAAKVADFFDRYGHRVSILLHGPARRDRGLVEEVLAAELPAHLEVSIIETDHPFVLGLAPLLAVDSYLEPSPPPRRVTLDDTYLGREGLLANPLALSPRDANGIQSPRPEA